uniref:Scm-like with four MBT domains protein 1 n=2 Tax=Cacopsylla melanoneura TaxID=428564 RepID=A0A8D9EQS5_9HEMI
MIQNQMDTAEVDALRMDDFMEEDPKDAEFDWDLLLNHPNLEAIPESCLPHVQTKANIILEAGMKIEMSYMEDHKLKYWVYTVIMNLGPIVRLRCLGDNNPNHDKWQTINSFKPNALGWCSRNNLSLKPPSYLSHVNVKQLLETLKEEESNTVQEYATFEFEQFVPGMKLEIEDEFCPYHVWVGNILENYRGRLQLRYDTPNSEETTFWLFYTSRRIHPYGWAKSQGAPWVIEKPSHMADTHSREAWAALSEMNMFNFEMECKISHIQNYKYDVAKLKHELTVGIKLEAIDPKTQVQISPATVVQIIDPYYFLVQIDESDSKFLATLDHPYIFPFGWSKSHGLVTTSDQDDTLPSSALTACFDKALKRNPDLPIAPGMKLEVVNPHNRNLLCVGTILRVCQDLVHVQCDIETDQTNNFWYNIMDCEVFPLGWSRTAGHPILPPTDLANLLKSNQDPPVSSQVTTCPPLGSIGCEKITIYLNHKCFTGPFLSKSKLAALPKVIGPGPIKLVLLDVVKRIANLAYVQMRILRELEASSSKPPEGRTREELKVKYKKRVYKGTIEVANRLDSVKAYCADVCKKLQVCTNLISLEPCPDCPLNCTERIKMKNTKDKKTNTKQSIDYKSFIYKPLTNPVNLVNRVPFQEDVPPPKETSPEDSIVWSKEKCLRKRKVNVYLEREKKRLKINDEETGSSNSKSKESEENSAEEEKQANGNKQTSQTINKEDGMNTNDTKRDIFLQVRTWNESKLPLPNKPNPLQWTEEDVFQCISAIPALCSVAPLLKAEAIDGLALTLLNLNLCRHNLNLDIDTSILLCRLIEIARAKYLSIFIQMNPCAEAAS